MTQSLDLPITNPPEHGGDTLTYDEVSSLSALPADRQADNFLAELGRMTSSERITASRYTMNRWEYFVYAARFPDEAPTVNGELEGIALTLE